MSAKHSRSVRFAASIALIPKVIAELPKAAVENVKGWKEDVKDEMDTRVTLARDVARQEA